MKTMLGDVSLEVLHDESSLIINATWHRAIVGHAWCTITDARLLIEDLKAEDQAAIPWPIANNLLVSIGIPTMKRNFRNRGVGKMLVQRLLSEARASGIREVWGSITQGDIDNAPHLMDWYRRLGFTVKNPDAECLHNAARKIVMQLDVGDAAY